MVYVESSLVLSERGLAERGLNQALARLRHQISHGTENHHLVPFSEVLQWLYALHEYHRIIDSEFFSKCASASAGEAFQAMIYARGRLTHGMVDVTRLTGARPFRLGISMLDGSDVLEGSGIQVHWADFSALPPTERAERRGRDALYCKHLSQEPLLTTLTTVTDWLCGLP